MWPLMKGGERVNGILLILLAMAGAIAYLAFKVNRLERLLDRSFRKRRSVSPQQESSVIPILKRDIEPGPFKTGNARRQPRPPESNE